MQRSKHSRMLMLGSLLILQACAAIQTSETPKPTRPGECDRYEIVRTSAGTLKDAAGAPLEDTAPVSSVLADAITIGEVRKRVGDTTATKIQVLRNNAKLHATCDAWDVLLLRPTQPAQK